ncbi:MAG: TIGR04372 family glycosyltransferase [Chlorobium sp.]
MLTLKVIELKVLVGIKILFKFLLFISFAPIVLLLVAIRPFVLIRFGTIRSERIGHFAADVDAYLCSCDNAANKRSVIDIISCPESVCNRQLEAMWRRTIKITNNKQPWALIEQACSFWTRGGKHKVNFSGRIDDYKYLIHNESHLTFTDNEERQGKELLKKLGIPEKASWICIHNRDSEYLDKQLNDYNWEYHNYRDFRVATMLLAAEELSRAGYYVVRVGSIVKEALVSKDSKIIDYASSPHQSDFGDIYLGANCVFYMGSDSGIASIPIIFRKPVSYINFCPTLISYFLDLGIFQLPFIPKHICLKSNKRLLNHREIFQIGLGCASDSQVFKNAGVELIDNTSEEIRDLAIEIDHRLKNTWVPQEGDEELQEKYWAVFIKSAPSVQQNNIKPRIGSAFLRKHRYLLD